VKFDGLIREGLTPANALGWPSFIVMLCWNTLANIIDSVHLENSQLGLRLFLLLLIQIGTWAALWSIVGVGHLLRRRIDGWPMFIALLVVAAVRGLVAQFVFDSASIPTATGAAVRVVYSVLYVGVGIALTALWIHQVRRHNHLLETMFGEQERLDKIKLEAEQKIIEANQSLISKIKADLLIRVNALQSSSVPEALATLRETIDHVIRPMSQQLAYANESWNPEPAKPRRVGVSWLRVIIDAFAIENIHPATVTLAATCLIGPATMQILTLSRAWSILIIVPLLQLGFLSAFKIMAMRKVLQPGRWIQAVVVIIGFICTGCIASLVTALLLANDAAAIVYAFPSSVVYTTVIGIASILLSQARKEMAKVEEQLASTTTEAGWQISRIKQRHRELEHALANQLHGKIQGALSATYLKLAASINDETISVPSLREFEFALTQNIRSLGDTSSRPFHFDETVEETRRTWANVCEVDVEISPGLRTLVYQDALLCHALEDLVPELAFNAVKHGKAKQFKLSLELTSSKTVRLTAENDGSRGEQTTRKGIGSNLLDDCCIHWERTFTESGTKVIAELPLNPDNLTSNN